MNVPYSLGRCGCWMAARRGPGMGRPFASPGTNRCVRPTPFAVRVVHLSEAVRAPHKALKLNARCTLTFDGRVEIV